MPKKVTNNKTSLGEGNIIIIEKTITCIEYCESKGIKERTKAALFLKYKYTKKTLSEWEVILK